MEQREVYTARNAERVSKTFISKESIAKDVLTKQVCTSSCISCCRFLIIFDIVSLLHLPLLRGCLFS